MHVTSSQTTDILLKSTAITSLRRACWCGASEPKRAAPTTAPTRMRAVSAHCSPCMSYAICTTGPSMPKQYEAGSWQMRTGFWWPLFSAHGQVYASWEKTAATGAVTASWASLESLPSFRRHAVTQPVLHARMSSHHGARFGMSVRCRERSKMLSSRASAVGNR